MTCKIFIRSVFNSTARLISRSTFVKPNNVIPIRFLSITSNSRNATIIKNAKWQNTECLHHRIFPPVESFTGGSRSFSSSSADVTLLKKRASKKRYASEIDPENMDEGHFTVIAYATAKEYDLEQLKMALLGEKLYIPQKLVDVDMPDVLFATAKYKIGLEPRQIFFFREGSVVFWNCSELESSNVLLFLKSFEEDSYKERVVFREREIMAYKYQESGKKCQLQGSTFLLSHEPDNLLEKYTFSNAMTQSVKLGVWENTLDDYADSLANVTEVLESGAPIKMTRAEILRKAGALFALRHHINLDSDLLDTPDFYWERAELERIYGITINYFSLARRTRVLNEKLSHCAELVELVGAQLSDHHHVRLEWMIIILIMVEVGFETLHFVERYWEYLQ
ncbi:required for meiotic nuclear division protein 1 homolog [Arctopsyche grandis]|uniref:required for meiotic nuclear division protein 1 homolog n=1 Tax=Arctopsyche grandis TaxID=121162 RepID=UPI00406D9E89